MFLDSTKLNYNWLIYFSGGDTLLESYSFEIPLDWRKIFERDETLLTLQWDISAFIRGWLPWPKNAVDVFIPILLFIWCDFPVNVVLQLLPIRTLITTPKKCYWWHVELIGVIAESRRECWFGYEQFKNNLKEPMFIWWFWDGLDVKSLSEWVDVSFVKRLLWTRLSLLGHSEMTGIL